MLSKHDEFQRRDLLGLVDDDVLKPLVLSFVEELIQVAQSCEVLAIERSCSARERRRENSALPRPEAASGGSGKLDGIVQELSVLLCEIQSRPEPLDLVLDMRTYSRGKL
jgi:hypothetical protein